MMFKAEIVTDFRKRKERGTVPDLTPETKVDCGRGDWHGPIKDAAREGKACKCPLCGNFIFTFVNAAISLYTFRVMEVV